MHRALQVYCKMLVLLAPAAACCNSDSGLPKTAPPVANKVLNDNNLAQDARPPTKSDTNATHANPVPNSIPHASTKTPLRFIWNVNWLVAKLKSFYPHYKIVKGSFHKKKNLFWGNGIDFSSPHWGQAGIGDRYFNDSQMKRALRKLRKQLKQRHAVIPKATRITFEPEHLSIRMRAYEQWAFSRINITILRLRQGKDAYDQMQLAQLRGCVNRKMIYSFIQLGRYFFLLTPNAVHYHKHWVYDLKDFVDFLNSLNFSGPKFSHVVAPAFHSKVQDCLYLVSIPALQKAAKRQQTLTSRAKVFPQIRERLRNKWKNRAARE